jgi:hypothetical protein
VSRAAGTTESGTGGIDIRIISVEHGKVIGPDGRTLFQW